MRLRNSNDCAAHLAHWFRTTGAVLVIALGGFAGTASALPAWSDVVAVDTYLVGGESVSYTHDITDDGFVPGADTAATFSLTITLRDDKSGGALGRYFDFYVPEVAFVDLAGTSADQSFSATLTDATLGVSAEALLSLQATGLMDITIASMSGDFWVRTSTLDVSAPSSLLPAVPPPAVPEPAAAAVFALGALIVAGSIRE